MGDGVLTHCGGPREQGVPSCDWSLTSLFSVYCSKLCFSGPPRLQDERQVCGRGGACSLQGLVHEGYWGGLTTGNSPAGWLKKLMKVSPGFCSHMEDRESVVSLWVVLWYSLRIVGCVSKFHLDYGSIGQLRSMLELVVARVRWLWGIVAAYLLILSVL